MYKKIAVIMLVLGILAACKSQTKEELLREGVKLSGQGNPTGAVVLFKNALEKDPNYFEARYQLALAYLETGKYEKAEKEFQKVLLQDPENFQVLLELASIYNFTERPGEAIAQVKTYLAKRGQSSQALEILGRSHALKGEFALAEDALHDAITLDPANFGARLDLSRVYLIQKRPGESRTQLEDVLRQDSDYIPALFAMARLETSEGHRDGALHIYRKIAELDKTNIEARFMAGILSLDAGEFGEAERVAADLLARFPKHPAGSRLQGMVHYLRGELEEAVVDLQNSLKTMPDLVGHYFLGLTHYKMEQYELALNQYQAALDMQPAHTQSRLMVAMTLLKQKRLDDAIAETVKVLARDPRNGLAYNIMGSAYLASGDFDKGMEKLDKALEIDPSLADAHLKKGLFNLAKGNPQRAEAELVAAVGIAPEHLNTRLLLAGHYLRQQNYTGALDTLQEGLSNRPQDALLYNYMAAAWFARKNNDRAVDALQKAKAIKQDYFAPYFNLANYYAASSQPQKALEEYRGVLRIDPNNLKALLRLAALQELTGDHEGALASNQAARHTGDPEGFLALARYHARQDRMEQALEVLKAAHVDHPAHPELLEMLGKVLIDRNQNEEAARVFGLLEKAQEGKGLPLVIGTYIRNGEIEKALGLAREKIDERPDSYYGYWLLASVHEKLGDRARAEQVLNKGIATVPDDLHLPMKLAALYAGAGRNQEAIATYESIRAAQPEFLPAVFGLAALHDGLGDKRRARTLYQEILSRDEHYTPALNNLAYLLAENYGDPKDALELAMKAYRTQPADPSILDTLGFVLVKNDRATEAVKVLEKAASKLPGVAAVQLHLAQAYRDSGQKDAALKKLQAVVDLGQKPEANLASLMLKELKD